jgi:tripartite-type tricarboxylate transporter receptor subunit TctC
VETKAGLSIGAVVAFFGAFFFSAMAPLNAQGLFAGKTVEIIVSANVGDSYDLLGRLVGRHIGQYLPGNPAVVVRNMPGAGGISAANHLANIAPKDGSVVGMLDQSILQTQQFSPAGLKADVRKMNWIGRIMSNNAGLYVWHTAKVQKIEDAYTNELVVSSSGRASQIRWTMLNNLVGLRFKMITGYKGATEGLLGMERGEVDGASMPWSVFRVIHADWIRDKKVNVLLQTGLERAFDLPDVPRLVDLARNEEQRQVIELISQPEEIGRSLTAPPDLTAERVVLWRTAFESMLKDARFQSEVKSMDLTLTPATGQEVQARIERSFNYAPEIFKKAQSLMQ